ncbi:MAG TPA: HAD family hydrolase [Candidatus Cloacimonadota bacterium]|nr:HAD family hydrolase [Candidatus Cloacimonadota bacterium]
MIRLKNITTELKGAIFDLDGTLVNTLDDIADTMNSILQKNGLPTHPTEKYKYLVGEGIFNLTKRVLPEDHWSEENAMMFVQEFRALYDITWHDKSLPYEGIIDMLKNLSQMGIKLGVLSNKPDSFVQKIIAWFFPQIPFTSVYGEVKDVPAKPDPELAGRVADAMGLNPQEIAMIGDSGIDIRTAVNAGMVGIGVIWGFRPFEELKETGASIVVNTPAEITTLFQNINE